MGPQASAVEMHLCGGGVARRQLLGMQAWPSFFHDLNYVVS